jgi:hypothetical protein
VLAASFVFCAVTSAPRAEAADEDPVMQCIAASNKGLDLRKQGKLIEARQTLAACASSACGSDISAVCQKRVGEINAALPSIVFLPKDQAGRDLLGVRMTIDGHGPGEVLEGRAVVVDPGPHSFKFELAGVDPVVRSLIVVEGAKDRQERVDLGAPLPPHAAGASGASSGGEQVPAAAPGSGRRALGLWVGIGGLVGVAAGAVFGGLAASQWSTSKSDCSLPGTPASCPRRDDAVHAHDLASTYATISTVAFAVGGAAVATGAVLILTAPRSAPAPGAARLVVGPRVGPGTAGLLLTGVFE